MTGNAGSGGRDEAYERLLRQEQLILDVTERLSEALEDSGVTRAELARRLNRTPGFVTQVLGGGRNLTLRTIADMAAALSLQPSFELSCERESVSFAAVDRAGPAALPPDGRSRVRKRLRESVASSTVG